MMHFLNSHAFQWFLVVGAIVTVIGWRLHALLNTVSDELIAAEAAGGSDESN